MKKKNIYLICIVSVICVILSVLFITSCGKKEEKNTSTVDNEIEDSNIQEVYDFKGEYLDVYKNKEVSEVRKFLGTAIVNVRPEEYRNFDIPIISEEDADAKLIFNLMHLESIWLEDYAISASKSNTRAYTISIVKPKEQYIEQVATSVSYRLEDLSRTLLNYPDQLYLVDNAVIEQVGDYLVMVICDNAKQVFDEIYEIMDTLDLANLDTISLMTEEERTEIENKSLQDEINALYDEIDEVVITPVEEDETNSNKVSNSTVE